MLRVIQTITFGMFFTPKLAIAHPGHGVKGVKSSGWDLAHYFVEAEHLLTILTLILIALITFWHLSRTKSKSE